MANIQDPVMGLTIPIPLSETGPLYAEDISDDLSRIATHTHTGAANEDGYQIPSDGLNINADLSFQSNNATNLRSVRLNNNGSQLISAGDINSLYDVSGNLWFNNAAGQPVQITAGSSIISISSDSYSTQSVTANLTIASNNNNNLFLITTSSVAITITLPTAASVAAGRFFIFADISGNANTNNITIRTAGGDTILGNASYLMNTNNGVVMISTDGINLWIVDKSDQVTYNNGETLIFASGSTLVLSGTGQLQAGSSSAIASTGSVALSGTTTISGTLVADTNVTFAEALSSPAVVVDAHTTDLQTNLLTIAGQDTYSGASVYTIGGGVTISSGQGSSELGTLSLKLGHSPATNVLVATPSQCTLAGGQSTSNITLSASTVNILPVVSQGSSLVIKKFGGTVNTQAGTHSINPCFVSTGASGADTTFFTYTFPSSTAATFQVSWLRRTPTGVTTALGNVALMVGICNSSGSITYNTLTPYVAASGVFDDAGKIGISATTNTLTFQAVAQVTAQDWQIIVTVNQA